MLMYNLIEYSDNYLKTSGILCQSCRDEPAINTAIEIMLLLICLKLKKKSKSNRQQWHKKC